MKDNLCSIYEIVKWYDNNADYKISVDFIIYLVNKGMIKPVESGEYDLNEVNSFLLYPQDSSYKKNEFDKFLVKDSRKKIIDKYPRNEDRKVKKFKITTLDGNKLKLMKIK